MQKGDCYKNFLVHRVVPIEELKATLIELEHLPSGAHVMQIENDDPENLFCLSFQTLPSNSNGVAHILEHTVLCGSKRFPVKDPFFAMTRRSLNTFMNALTGADFTCYPAASQVEKDFYNLLDVYLDAVFHPQLKRESFLQEGHRLELSDSKDLNSPLIWKGVVYNEMKGAMAPADTRMWHEMMRALVPDLTYAHVSGGDPAVIPSLSYEELIQFYETFYHPSRCLFFFYGNLPLKHHLDFIEERVLKGVVKLSPLQPQPRQKRFSRPIERVGYYPIDEDDQESRTIGAWGWLTVPVQDQETLLALTLVDLVLMETDASLLKLPLLQSGLCTSADALMDPEMSEVPLLIVCKGCKAENIEAIEALIFKTLQEIVSQGIPSHVIEAALHQLEFSRMEIAGDHAPFGLTLFLRSALAKQHGCDPENGLVIHSLFKRLREKLKDPAYLTGLITTYLLKNPHRVRLSLHPDGHLAKHEASEEREKLDILGKTMPLAEREKLAKEMAHLAEYQKKIEGQNLECLPKVVLDDVPVLARQLNLKEESGVFHHACFTNHIIYADLVFDLPKVEEEELPYIQFLASVLPELGMGKRDYVKNLEYLQSHVGGLSVSLGLYTQVENPHEMRPALTVRGKALEQNGKELFEIFKDLVAAPRLDESNRIIELLKQIETALRQRLQKNGLRYASSLAISSLAPAAQISERWQGVSYFQWIEKMAANPKLLLERLPKIKDRLLSLHAPHLVVTCDEMSYDRLAKDQFYGVMELPQKSHTPWKIDFEVNPLSSQARPIATPVAFTCEAYKVAPYLHPHAPALMVATHLLENKILFPKIREQGGAYGAGASYAPMGGYFTFHSYRDPHIVSTLKTFEESVEVIAKGNFESSDLESAKLETIQQFDIPIAPGSRGITAYGWMREGKTLDRRQQFRDRLLQLTPHEISLAVRKELVGKKGCIVTFAGKNLIEKENLELEKPLPIISI